MNTIFAINFRREAYQQEIARARQRVVQLGLWFAYFGAVAIVLGLYGLNCASLQHRTASLEREAARLKSAGGTAAWHPGPAEANVVDLHIRNPMQWHQRLARLPELLPANARITSLQFNPDNASNAGEQKLVVTGDLRSIAGQDRMQQVLAFVNTLSRDSLFSVGYSNVRLVTTRAAASGDGAEFVIECH